MLTELYLRKLTRELAGRMIFLDHALAGAVRRNDAGMAQQFYFQRYRVQGYRSDLLRELWEQRKHKAEVNGAEDEALRPTGV